MFFGGNGDLYYVINSTEKNNVINFEITKENYELYCLFDELYKRIIDCDIYKISEVEFTGIIEPDEDTINRQVIEFDKWNQSLKTTDKYKSLAHNGIISWKSDDQIYEEANILNIYKEEDKYRLEFISNKERISNFIDIGFRNRGSRYSPFHIPFMELYNVLKNIEIDHHQMHIEEYLYQKKLTKKLNI